MQGGSSLIRGSRARFQGRVYWGPSRSASTRAGTMASKSLAVDWSACPYKCTWSTPSIQPLAASCEKGMAACLV
jgi:hypothetical protein